MADPINPMGISAGARLHYRFGEIQPTSGLHSSWDVDPPQLPAEGLADRVLNTKRNVRISALFFRSLSVSLFSFPPCIVLEFSMCLKGKLAAY